MAGQLGVEDWDVGQRTGEGDGQRSVQSAGIESYVLDSWIRSNERFLSKIISVARNNHTAMLRCRDSDQSGGRTKFPSHNEGARVEAIKDGHVIVLPLEETHQLFVA